MHPTPNTNFHTPNTQNLNTKEHNHASKKHHTKLPFGFTLTELIVVISILAILATIAFVSIGNYFSSARDSARSMDIASISKSMEIFMEKTNNYPPPDNGKAITFSGGELWTQGTIGDSVMRMLGNVNKEVVDPKFGNEYTYSLLASIPGTNSKRAYTIAGVFESPSAYASLIPSTIFSNTAFAANVDSSVFTAYTKGTYNGMVAKTKTGTTCVTIALPSIVIGEIPASGAIEDIGAGAFVYAGKKNLPPSYSSSLGSGTIFTGAFQFRDYSNVTEQQKLILSTDCAVPITPTELTSFSNNIEQAYAGTSIASDGTYSPIVATATASDRIKLSANIINNYLGGTVAITNETVLPAFSCASPAPNATSIPNSNTYTTGLPTSFNQPWVYSNVASNCTFACDSGYTWNGTSCVVDQCGGGNVATYNGIPNGPQSYTGTWSYNTNAGLCNYTCNGGYTYNGGTLKCEPDNCTAQLQIVGGHNYSVPVINHANIGTITSSVVTIPGGTVTYTQNFSCSVGSLSVSGSETVNTPSCSTGFHLEGASCIADSELCTYTNGVFSSDTQPANSTSGTKVWNSISTSYGSCSGFACNSGYGLSGGSCVLIPGAPTGLASASIATTTFTLNWNASAGATGYRVYKDGSQYGSDLGTATTTLNVTGQTSGATASWTISAFNAGGESSKSAPVSVTQATTCTAGSYSATGYSPCTAATAGNYVASAGATAQIAAAIGNYVATTSATAQVACAIGTYQDTTGQSTCKTPTAGYWASPTNNATANTTQTQCVAGTYCSGGVKNNATAGSYVASAGATAQVAAAIGNYVPAANATAQIQCAANTYQASTGQSSCTACPGGTTSPAGSTSSAQCIVSCPSGYSYVAAAGKCYSPLRGPTGYQAAWDNCAADGATIISSILACSTVCSITGNCGAIASDKMGWWKGFDRNSYGVRVINSTSCPSGAGSSLAISSYPDLVVTAIMPAGDTADGTHYYWCEK